MVGIIYGARHMRAFPICPPSRGVSGLPGAPFFCAGKAHFPLIRCQLRRSGRSCMPDALPPVTPRFLVSAGLSLTLCATSEPERVSGGLQHQSVAWLTLSADEDWFEPTLRAGAGSHS